MAQSPKPKAQSGNGDPGKSGSTTAPRLMGPGRGGFLARPRIASARRWLSCWLLVLIVLTATQVQAADYVYDQLKIFSSQETSQLSAWALSIDQATGIEMVIASVDLKDQPIDKVAVDLFAQYKVGKAGQDNGVLLLIAPNQRLYRFEVGYGLEGMLPDGLVGEWGRTYLAPAFAKGQYFDGVQQVIRQGLVPAITRETGKTVSLGGQQPRPQASPSGGVSPGQAGIGLIALLLLWLILWRVTGDPFALLQIIFLLMRMSGGGRGGGGDGGGGRSGGGRSGGGGAGGGW